MLPIPELAVLSAAEVLSKASGALEAHELTVCQAIIPIVEHFVSRQKRLSRNHPNMTMVTGERFDADMEDRDRDKQRRVWELPCADGEMPADDAERNVDPDSNE